MAWFGNLVGQGSFAAWCGAWAAVLSAVAYAPYIRDTIAGRTRPHRASWLIWSVLGAIAMMSQIDEGAGASLWFAVIQVGATITIFALSTKRGRGTLISDRDIPVIAVAGFGLVLWSTTGQSVYALVITMGISLVGGLPTALKSYYDYESETLGTWAIALAASALAVLAVGAFNPVLLAYPAYLLVLYSTLVGANLLGRWIRPEVKAMNRAQLNAGLVGRGRPARTIR